jgi:EpsI family protein
MDAGVLLFLAVITYLSVYHRGPVPLKQSFTTFPATIGQWVQLRENRELPILRAVGAEEELHRVYVGPGKQRLHLYVAHFESQQQGKEAASYMMAPFHQGSQTLRFPSSHPGARDGSMFAANESRNRKILFWYDINGRILANRLATKALTIWDAVTRGRTNGALVMVYCERDPNVSQEPNSEQMKDFSNELLPVLRNYLP